MANAITVDKLGNGRGISLFSRWQDDQFALTKEPTEEFGY